MLEKLLSLTCMNRKLKKRLPITQGSAGDSSSQPIPAINEKGDGSNHDESSISIPVFPESSPPFVSKILTEASLKDACQENRATPIDFEVSEVRNDSDVIGVVMRRRTPISVTPSPIPEDNEYPANIMDSPVHRNRFSSVIEDKIYEASGDSCQPTLKPKKLAELYNTSNSTASPSSSSNNDTYDGFIEKNVTLGSTSYHSLAERKRNIPMYGGSLRLFKSRRPSLPDSTYPQSKIRQESDRFRLRKRVDTSRRDAVEAGFEPKDSVPRCHSTQSLREIQGSKSYSKSQFQVSDLSLNPNGHVTAACDSTTAPTAIVNPNSVSNGKLLKPSHSRSTYDYEQDRITQQDRRRSLHTLTGASSLYQMTCGRSQFTPQTDISGDHHRSRIRVSSVNHISDSNETKYSIDQRRSVHNISNPVRNSFTNGIKTTSTPKNQVAVAPLAHKSRHLSQSRDEMRSERRGSGGGMNLPAYQSYVMRHSGEERLVDGPANTPENARIAYLEQRIHELELKNRDSQITPVMHNRQSRSSHYNGNLPMGEQIKMQEMNDELMNKEAKIANLEKKLLKSYQKIENLGEDYQRKINKLLSEGENAKDDLTQCISKIRQLESELDSMHSVAQSGDHVNDQVLQELKDKIWKQERELHENRVLLIRAREKESEYERMKSEKGHLELKNETLQKKLDARNKTVEDLERSVSNLRLEQTICQQSCSSGSTPLADECEAMSDIRPSMARPYMKAHSTLGSNIAPLPHSKSSGLTKSFSNFAINSSKQRDDVTPMMSRTIREQNRHITMCRAMVVCLKDTVDRLAKGENIDVASLLGVKLNMMSESEFEEEDYEADESKPFSMMAAESALSKQCQKLWELDKDLDTIRCQLAEWHSQNDAEGDGDREVCRVQ